MAAKTNKNNARKIPPEAAALLKSYVYVYSDPQTGEPFYIGKGKGARAFAHLDSPDGEKGEKINAIRKRGLQPRIDILRYGISEQEALSIEAAAIDLIGKDKLTNIASGVTRGYGRVSFAELLDTFTAKRVTVRHKALLFKISRLYHKGMTPRQLYEVTRGAWILGKNREKTEYAIALYQGVAKEVYRVHDWHPAGTLEYERDISDWKIDDRWEFEGEVAEESVRRLYVGNKMHIDGKKINGQSPALYANIKGARA